MRWKTQQELKQSQAISSNLKHTCKAFSILLGFTSITVRQNMFYYVIIKRRHVIDAMNVTALWNVLTLLLQQGYRNLHQVRSLLPTNIPWAACTATATAKASQCDFHVGNVHRAPSCLNPVRSFPWCPKQSAFGVGTIDECQKTFLSRQAAQLCR